MAVVVGVGVAGAQRVGLQRRLLTHSGSAAFGVDADADEYINKESNENMSSIARI